MNIRYNKLAVASKIKAMNYNNLIIKKQEMGRKYFLAFPLTTNYLLLAT